MSSPPTYPIDVRPCIPVCQAGQYLALGMRETLIQAHHLDDLALPLPPAHDALLRTLTAITAELTGLDDPDLQRSAPAPCTRGDLFRRATVTAGV